MIRWQLIVCTRCRKVLHEFGVGGPAAEPLVVPTEACATCDSQNIPRQPQTPAEERL